MNENKKDRFWVLGIIIPICFALTYVINFFPLALLVEIYTLIVACLVVYYIFLTAKIFSIEKFNLKNNKLELPNTSNIKNTARKIGKIIVKLVLVYVVGIIALNFFMEPFHCGVFDCYYMTWSEYDEVTEDIHGLIEGTKWDTSRVDSILFPPSPSYPFDEPNAGYCCVETYTLRGFLEKAYTSALNNKKKTARFYLWWAEIFLKYNKFILADDSVW